MFKRKRLILIPALFLLSGAILAYYAQKAYVAPILMYHQVIPDAPLKDPLTVTVISFERQMAFLKKQRYNVVSLKALADLIRAKKKIPPRTLAITFDDGCIDNYTNAFPILKKYRLPATMFIIVSEAGRERGDKMNWEQLREMRASGLVSIGSHAFAAEPLVNLKLPAELEREIFASKRILEEKLGGEVNTFSYPEGRFDGAIRQMVIDAGYRLAVATNPGKKFASDDVFALKRLRISSVCDDLFVFGVEISGLYTFMRESRRK
ncbi:MAG: polysaccharide deacetylase family protein [Candidatus Omnitrophota bacterium]|nr:polysaccharide deacetylase family protein [Candidatus Omnitrophota bacterium]